MSSLVRNLQADLLSSQKTITEILRTAKVVSAKLGLNSITAWLELELHGYQTCKATDLPSYRRFKGGRLDYFNPYHGWLSAGYMNAEFPIHQPIPTIEDLAKDNFAFIPLTQQNKISLTGHISGIDGLINQFDQRFTVSTSAFRHVLETVKNKILDWTIELESLGILGEDMAFGDKEKESAKSTIFNIQNFTGVAGNVTEGSTVQIYNYSSIFQQVKDAGVVKTERDKLEEIMDDLAKAKPAEKVSMIEKAKGWLVKNEKVLGATASVVRKALGLDTPD